MRVQRVVAPGTDETSWTMVDEDLRPVEAAERYLAHLAALERSPNTVRAYAALPLPTAQRATVQSYQRRIEALLDANRELREENRRLNERLAEVLGQGRDPHRRHVTDEGSLERRASPRGRSR